MLTYTQCAQTWPLTDAIAFENIDGALNVLRQACEYLHHGLTQMGAAVEQSGYRKGPSGSPGDCGADPSSTDASVRFRRIAQALTHPRSSVFGFVGPKFVKWHPVPGIETQRPSPSHEGHWNLMSTLSLATG